MSYVKIPYATYDKICTYIDSDRRWLISRQKMSAVDTVSGGKNERKI